MGSGVMRNHRGYRVGEDHHRTSYPDAVVARAVQLRAEGLTYRAIGEQVGVPTMTVRDWCQGWTRWARRA